MTEVMRSVYKRGRRFKKVENEDIISNLPSSLISHILSFLPIKDAVATGVLSTRWKYLWTAVTNMDFDDGLLVEPINPRKRTKRKLRSVEMSFINFVNRVFICHTSFLHTFRLRCTQNYGVSILNFLVSTALARNLRELHLFFQIEDYSGLAHENVKILLIEELEFLDDVSINRLFSGCPLLEELSIKTCYFKNISMFHISAPALKSLVISCWSKVGYKLVLDTPNLQDLQYHDHVTKGYSMNKLNALVNADIGFVLRGHPDHDGSAEEHVEELFEGISKVQWLRLSDDSMKLCRSLLPKFDHLTCLEISCKNVRWKSLLDFLESSPQLEQLKLVFGGALLQDRFEENQTTCSWYQPKNVPSCLLCHLKEIKIMRFEGKSDELKMAEYFLKNSKVLEKLMIRPCINKRSSKINRRTSEINMVRMLPRGSEKCRVVTF
ncbi:F-box/LRR-repeat protein At4g14096-like isoform X2 [Cornus florida]|uniref:F-box/LRR-repeat protein At4g14096-like isoform X2 n=1 Tax=Cornus florida TaxID=4283 RepID=UPI0028A04F56|nr:F-box/LRR-repeat protein At4g14096-like isoform X2 [Cornus florida]